MRLNPVRWVLSPWAPALLFTHGTLVSSGLVLSALAEHSWDRSCFIALGVVNALAVLVALFLAVGHLSETGESKPLRGLSFAAFLGGCFGVLPPIWVAVGLLCSLLLRTQGLVG